MNRKWQLAFILAILNDAVDYIGIGAVPVLGDILDAATSLALWRLLGVKYTAPTGLEFIPGSDFLPIHITSVGVAYLHNKKGERKRTS